MDEKIILLVEDTAADEKLMVRALKKNRIANQVVVVRDGVEALDYLLGTGPYAGKPAPPLPQVMLLDLNLPKLDGHEVLRRLRAEPRTTRLPVVILTTSSEDKDAVASYDLGANSYVRKPIDFDEFTEAVRQLGLYWLILNQAAPAPGGT